MAYDFNGTTSMIAATVVGPSGTSWTAAAWVEADGAGEGNAGEILSVEDAGAVRIAFRFAAGLTLLINQAQVSGASATASTAVVAGRPTCCIGVHDAVADQSRIYLGTLNAPMAEVAYSAGPTTGSGAYGSSGADLTIGNRRAAANTWDGRIGPVVFDPVNAWSFAQMESFRRTGLPPVPLHQVYWWPLASHSLDLSGHGANGTETAVTVAGDPPLPGAIRTYKRMRVRAR